MQLTDYTTEIITLIKNNPDKAIDALKNKKTQNQFIAFCKNEKILPFVIYKLLAHDNKLSNMSELIEIKNLYIFDYLRKVRSLIHLARKFESSNIEYVVLKGLSVNAYYPKEELRYFSDLDILVKPNDIQRSFDVLKDCGFRYAKHDICDSTIGSKKYSRHLPEMINSDGIIVELHHRVTSPITYNSCPLMKACLQSKVQKKIANNYLNLLPPDMSFVVTAYHGADQFKQITDLRFLIDLLILEDKTETSIFYIKEKYSLMLTQGEIDKAHLYLSRLKNLTTMKKNKSYFLPPLNIGVRHYLKRAMLVFHQISYEKQIHIHDVKIKHVINRVNTKFP